MLSQHSDPSATYCQKRFQYKYSFKVKMPVGELKWQRLFFFTCCPRDWLFHSCPDAAASYMPGMPAVSSYGPNPSPGWDICQVPFIVFHNAFCISAQIPLAKLPHTLLGGKQDGVIETVWTCDFTFIHWFQRLPSIPVPRGQLLPHHWGIYSLSQPDSSFHSGYVSLSLPCLLLFLFLLI